MALQIADRVMESSTSTGTGAFTLAGAYTGYRAFSAVCSVSDSLYYCIEALDANGNPSGAWEVGLGTYSGTNTLTRTTVHFSSNSNSAVSFAAGTKRVSLDATATQLGLYAQKANNLSDLASASTARTNLGLAIGTNVHAQAPSVQSVTSSATVTPTFSDDAVKVTAQAAGLTLANPSGTAVSMWGWAIRIKDNGTAQSIIYGTQYRAIGVTLPTATVISKTLYLGCVWNNDDSKVDVVAVAQEA